MNWNAYKKLWTFLLSFSSPSVMEALGTVTTSTSSSFSLVTPLRSHSTAANWDCILSQIVIIIIVHFMYIVAALFNPFITALHCAALLNHEALLHITMSSLYSAKYMSLCQMIYNCKWMNVKLTHGIIISLIIIIFINLGKDND